MMTELFYPDSILWLILGCAGGGLLGWFGTIWFMDLYYWPRFTTAPGVRFLTVWDAEGNVLYDCPVRGRGARAFYRLTRSLMAKPVFLAPFMFPRKLPLKDRGQH